MFKKIFCTIFFVLFFAKAYSQTVQVVDATTGFPIPGVNVFSPKIDDTLQTNNVGEVSLDLFDNAMPIFFEHFVFASIKTDKEKIRNNNFIIEMQRAGMLANEGQSVITAEEYSKDLPFYVEIINLDNTATLSADDDDSGEKIMFEKNKGGSTVFTSWQANKVIIVMDGVRLNNALYRNGKIAGPLNFESVALERMQQVYGSGYVMYGSDAIGGVIQYFTKMPTLNKFSGVHTNVNAVTKYETATNTWVSNVNFNLGTKKLASFTSLTYGKYGEIKMGKNRANYLDDDYGLNNYYVERINGQDSMMINENPLAQKNTDYKQFLAVQKFRYKPNKKLNIILNLHYNTASKIKFYSGLTEINRGQLRFSEIEFRPQDKFHSSLDFLYENKTKYFDFVSAIVAYQFIEEYRYSRKFRNPVGLHQIEHLHDASINLDFVKIFEFNRLTYGFEGTYNYLNSNAFFENIETDSIWDGLTRYPTNGSDMQTLSAYITYKWLSNPQFVVTTGARYDFSHSVSRFEDQLTQVTKNPQMNYNFGEIIYNNHSPSASINFDVYPFSGFQLSLLNSFSVHAPIVDEFGKIMLKDFIAIVPNNSLKPEKSLNIELGASQILFESIKFNVGIFNSWVRDAIIVSDHQINGIDSLWLGIDGYEMATNINIKNAQIYGINGGIHFGYFFGQKDKNHIKVNSTINYIEGWNKDQSIALPKIPPLFGQTVVSLKLRDYSFRFSHVYNGQKKYEDLSIYGEDYIEKAADFGFMAWQTYNMKISYQTSENLSLSFAVNNIFNTFYRRYSSAISSPGRNVVFTFKLNF